MVFFFGFFCFFSLLLNMIEITLNGFVGQDVVRTDRDTQFLSERGYYAVLLDILASYAFYDRCFAYTQGLSDMLSPILVVMDDEACTSIMSSRFNRVRYY